MEEQLLQEARIEAEKVYPDRKERSVTRIPEKIIQLERTAYIDGYIAKAKKIESEAVEFSEWIIKKGFTYNHKRCVWLDWNDTYNYNTTSLYELFKQQKQE